MDIQFIASFREPLYNKQTEVDVMSLKIEDAKRVLETFERLEKKGKKKPSAIDEMEGIFADLFPKDKSSVDIIRDNRKKMFEK